MKFIVISLSTSLLLFIASALLVVSQWQAPKAPASPQPGNAVSNTVYPSNCTASGPVALLVNATAQHTQFTILTSEQTSQLSLVPVTFTRNDCTAYSASAELAEQLLLFSEQQPRQQGNFLLLWQPELSELQVFRVQADQQLIIPERNIIQARPQRIVEM